MSNTSNTSTIGVMDNPPDIPLVLAPTPTNSKLVYFFCYGAMVHPRIVEVRELNPVGTWPGQLRGYRLTFDPYCDIVPLNTFLPKKSPPGGPTSPPSLQNSPSFSAVSPGQQSPPLTKQLSPPTRQHADCTTRTTETGTKNENGTQNENGTKNENGTQNEKGTKNENEKGTKNENEQGTNEKGTKMNNNNRPRYSSQSMRGPSSARRSQVKTPLTAALASAFASAAVFSSEKSTLLSSVSSSSSRVRSHTFAPGKSNATLGVRGVHASNNADPTSSVHGVVYLVSEEALLKMDAYESEYKRVTLPVHVYAANTPGRGLSSNTFVVEAVVYQRASTRTEAVRPPQRCLAAMAEGCRIAGCRSDWVAFLQGLPFTPRRMPHQFLELPSPPADADPASIAELALLNGQGGRPYCFGVNGKVVQYSGDPAVAIRRLYRGGVNLNHLGAQVWGRDLTLALLQVAPDPVLFRGKMPTKLSQLTDEEMAYAEDLVVEFCTVPLLTVRAPLVYGEMNDSVALSTKSSYKSASAIKPAAAVSASSALHNGSNPDNLTASGGCTLL